MDKAEMLILAAAVLAASSAQGQDAFLIDYFGPAGNMYKIGLYNPIPETLIGSCQPFLGDAEFNGSNSLYAFSSQGPAFYQIDTTTAVSSHLADIEPLANHMWSGLAYDPISGEMYASSTTGGESSFYLLDIDSLKVTLIGTTTEAEAVVDISFDDTGQLYAHDLPNRMFTIDRETGAAELIGLTGFQGAGSWHGLDYCYQNHTMYMATYNSITMVRSIRTVNLSTGMTTEVGTTTRGAGGFAIVSPPSGLENQAEPVPQGGFTAISPNPATGGVSISFGDTGPESRLLITDLTGREIVTLQGASPVFWDGSSSSGSSVSGGLYLVHLLDEGCIADTGKVMILR